MEELLKSLKRDQLEKVVQEANIRSQVPRYTKVKKSELIDMLKEKLELVEKDGDMCLSVKKQDADTQ